MYLNLTNLKLAARVESYDVDGSIGVTHRQQNTWMPCGTFPMLIGTRASSGNIVCRSAEYRKIYVSCAPVSWESCEYRGTPVCKKAPTKSDRPRQCIKAVCNAIYSARSLSHKTSCKYEVSTFRNSAATRSRDFASVSRQRVVMPFTI
jgi:hypothetical protein